MEGHPPDQIAFETLVAAAVIAVTIASIVSLVLAAIEGRFFGTWASLKRIWPALVGYSIPVTLVAYTAGFFTGFSRSAAIGTVLPAVLALIGGLNIYVFGSDAKYKVLVAYCVCLFTAVLFYSTHVGAYKREAEREIRLKELARQELIIRTIRKNLDLPDDFPQWIVSGEPK
jgi:hypothetical protein